MSKDEEGRIHHKAAKARAESTPHVVGYVPAIRLTLAIVAPVSSMIIDAQT